eukprot:12648490-Alexandrium_andersonii.AAC.1
MAREGSPFEAKCKFQHECVAPPRLMRHPQQFGRGRTRLPSRCKPSLWSLGWGRWSHVPGPGIDG